MSDKYGMPTTLEVLQIEYLGRSLASSKENRKRSISRNSDMVQRQCGAVGYLDEALLSIRRICSLYLFVLLQYSYTCYHRKDYRYEL